LSFFAGGVAGGFGFQHFGYIATVPLAIALSVLAFTPIFDDMKQLAGAWCKSR
jgi:hypothetical protein